MWCLDIFTPCRCDEDLPEASDVDGYVRTYMYLSSFIY
jgi:hypothetical protein